MVFSMALVLLSPRMSLGAGGMAQKRRAFVTLPDDWSLAPSAHIRQPAMPLSPASGDLMLS